MERSFRTYLRVFGAGTLGGLGAVFALTLLVDPLGAYRSWSLRQFEPYRGRLTSRAAKAELVAQSGYDGVLLGSPRVLVGSPVRHPAYGSARVCSLALNGTTLGETSGVLDFALRHNRLKRVLLGVDLHMFSDTRQAKTTFEASRFNPDLD